MIWISVMSKSLIVSGSIAPMMYRRAIALDPEYAFAHNNLGVFLRSQGRINEAEVMYRKAITLDPKYFNAHNNLGSLLQEKGRQEEADKHFRIAKALRKE